MSFGDSLAPRDADSQRIGLEFSEFGANSFRLQICCEFALKFGALRITCKFGLRISLKVPSAAPTPHWRFS